MEKPEEEKTAAAQAPAEKPAETTAAADAKKKSGMKKGVKIALYALGGLVALVVLALISLPLWISPVVTSVAEAVAPAYTGCEFKMEEFNLNPFTGKLKIVGVRLSNPKGYDEPEAFSVATVNVEVATCSLLTSKIHVHDITIQSPFVGVSFANGTNNFSAILANVQSKLGTSEETAEEPQAEEKKDEGSSKKVIIDHFELSGTRVKLGMLPIAIPSITLNDIGKESDGATFAEVGNEVMESCKKFMTDIGGAASGLLKGAANGVGGAADKATEVLGQGASAIGSGAKNAAESLKKLNPFGK